MQLLLSAWQFGDLHWEHHLDVGEGTILRVARKWVAQTCLRKLAAVELGNPGATSDVEEVDGPVLLVHERHLHGRGRVDVFDPVDDLCSVVSTFETFPLDRTKFVLVELRILQRQGLHSG